MPETAGRATEKQLEGMLAQFHDQVASLRSAKGKVQGPREVAEKGELSQKIKDLAKGIPSVFKAVLGQATLKAETKGMKKELKKLEEMQKHYQEDVADLGEDAATLEVGNMKVDFAQIKKSSDEKYRAKLKAECEKLADGIEKNITNKRAALGKSAEVPDEQIAFLDMIKDRKDVVREQLSKASTKTLKVLHKTLQGLNLEISKYESSFAVSREVFNDKKTRLTEAVHNFTELTKTLSAHSKDELLLRVGSTLDELQDIKFSGEGSQELDRFVRRFEAYSKQLVQQEYANIVERLNNALENPFLKPDEVAAIKARRDACIIQIERWTPSEGITSPKGALGELNILQGLAEDASADRTLLKDASNFRIFIDCETVADSISEELELQTLHPEVIQSVEERKDELKGQIDSLKTRLPLSEADKAKLEKAFESLEHLYFEVQARAAVFENAEFLKVRALEVPKEMRKAKHIEILQKAEKESKNIEMLLNKPERLTLAEINRLDEAQALFIKLRKQMESYENFDRLSS